MKTTWIMQTNMGESSDVYSYVQGVKDSGADVVEVTYLPFSPDLPYVEVSGPVVLYGMVSFIQKMQERNIYPLGVFGTPETFTYKAWAKNYNELLLNSPDSTHLTTIGDFSMNFRLPDDDIFVRPQHDTKSLVGTVWTAKKFHDWCIVAKTGSYAGVDKDTPIVVGKPYGIEAEWRLFIVDGHIAGSSQYQKKGRLFKSPGAPEDVLSFAMKAIERWDPAPAYTLDICRSAGNCYIVEAQGFNSAGHYSANISEVARKVNSVAVKLWENNKSKLKILL